MQTLEMVVLPTTLPPPLSRLPSTPSAPATLSVAPKPLALPPPLAGSTLTTLRCRQRSWITLFRPRRPSATTMVDLLRFPCQPLQPQLAMATVHPDPLPQLQLRSTLAFPNPKVRLRWLRPSMVTPDQLLLPSSAASLDRNRCQLQLLEATPDPFPPLLLPPLLPSLFKDPTPALLRLQPRSKLVMAALPWLNLLQSKLRTEMLKTAKLKDL